MRSKGRIRMLLVLVALAAPLAARADQAQEDSLAKKAKDAAAAGRVFESRDAYCELAKANPNYPQATMMCSVMKKEAEKEDARCDDRFTNASNDAEQKKFDDAEQKLKNVKQGCKKYDEARQLLARIPQLKREAEAKAGDAVMAQKYNEALQAYNRNDFTSAKSGLSQVTGSKGGDAQALLNKIKQYEQAISEGDRLFGSKNYGAARNSYQEAAKLKSDGPGDPNGKIQKANDAEKAALAQMDEQKRKEEEARREAERRAKKPSLALKVTPTSGQAALTVSANANASAQTGGTSVVGTLIQWGDGSQTSGATGSHVYKNPGTYDVVAWVTDDVGNKVSQTQTVRVIEAAVKQVVPEVDVAQTLAEARAAKAKGNIALAKGKYMKVLGADKNNAEANAALEELSKQAVAAPVQPAPEPQTPGVISDSDQLLAQGITEYYTGNFDDAYSDLRNYLKFKGEKVGLANFYLGALKATQYHLGGASDPKLKEAAEGSFRVAKKAPNFKPPQKYISPKIMDMYNGAGM